MTFFRSRSRSSPIVAILVVTAVLAGVLTYQALEADHYHRAAAVGAVKDYADFAAWEFAVAAKEDVYQTLVAVFGPVRHQVALKQGAPLPPPGILLNDVTSRVQCADPGTYAFRVDYATRRIVLEGGSASAETQGWIRDTIIADLKNYKKDWTYQSFAATLDGRPGAIAYQVKYDHNWKPVAAYGLPVCARALLSPSFARALQSHKLLPPSLTKKTPNDSLLSVIVYDDAGNEVWRTPQQFPMDRAGEASMAYFGKFVSKVALNPARTGALVIGGVPPSRVPVLLTILGVTVALAVFGVMLLRREDQLARLRGDFIASVSHELRTPLAQLRMFAETLRLGRVRSEEEKQRSLEIVDQEARRLSHLVENILQFSRAERHAIKLAPVDVQLSPHVAAAIEAFHPIARARRVEILTSLDETLHGVVDTGALRQILLNLLDNAVKYGPEGQQVHVSLLPSADRRRARLIVEDQGPGIPRDKRQLIWEPFYRMERDADSAVAGSGIGLSVVRELAVRQGGAATCEDPAAGGGMGARFVVELPLCQSGASAPASTNGTPVVVRA